MTALRVRGHPIALQVFAPLLESLLEYCRAVKTLERFGEGITIINELCARHVQHRLVGWADASSRASSRMSSCEQC